MSARAHARPGTRRHGHRQCATLSHPIARTRLTAYRHGLSARPSVCGSRRGAAAHPLELGDGDPFDGRRRPVRVVHLVRIRAQARARVRARARARVRARVRVRVRVVHRPRRHGRDRSSVGPVRTTGHCAAQAPLNMPQRCVRVRVQMVGLHAGGSARVRAAPMYLPTCPQMVHLTPCTWQWPHTSQIGSRSRFGPLMGSTGGRG